MDRLTEWYDDGQRKGILVKESYGENCLKTLYQKFGDYPVGEFLDYEEGYFAMHKLAELEDLEEQGLLLRLPCPIGTDVYYIFGIPGKTRCVIESTPFDLTHIKRIGVNMWLTPEEAEAALEKMKGEEHETD